MTRTKPEPDTKEFTRQNLFSVYGDGPLDEGMGIPCGFQDVATLRLLPGFIVVRTEYLDALKSLVDVQRVRIAQLEKPK